MTAPEQLSGVPLVLGSSSPRRAELLTQLGFEFSVRAPHVDETVGRSESADDYVKRLAISKSAAVHEPGWLTLGADTVVVLDARILGKPLDVHDHRSMLEALSGRSHLVLTAVCARSDSDAQTTVVRSTVTFRAIDASEIVAYTNLAEGRDKAGGYAIQGLAGMFVSRLEGSYSGVVGLPLAETEHLLCAAGWDTWHNRMHPGHSTPR